MHKERLVLTFIVFALVGMGIVMIYSTSAIYASEKFNDSYYFLKRQIFWVAIGILIFYAASRIPFPLFRQFKWPILIFSLLLLICVFVPLLGKSAGGARRWIQFTYFTFQPSEFAKMAMIIFLADFLTLRNPFWS